VCRKQSQHLGKFYTDVLNEGNFYVKISKAVKYIWRSYNSTS